jgi:hypothetical protein
VFGFATFYQVLKISSQAMVPQFAPEPPLPRGPPSDWPFDTVTALLLLYHFSSELVEFRWWHLWFICTEILSCTFSRSEKSAGFSMQVLQVKLFKLTSLFLDFMDSTQSGAASKT